MISWVVYGSTGLGLTLAGGLTRLATFLSAHFRSKQKPKNWRSSCSSFAAVVLARSRPDSDLWIAAMARQLDLPLATRDAHFVQAPRLKMLAW